MKNLLELLDRVSQDFEESNPNYQENLKKVSDIDSFSDLEILNGEVATQKRLSDLSIDPRSNPEFLERIIGRNCLMDLSYFKKGLEVAKTVCRIVHPKDGNYDPHGTGFLVGPGLLMTNNHVIKNAIEANGLVAEFEYERGLGKKIGDSYFFRFDPTSFFITNLDLDYTVIGVEAIASNDPNKKLGEYKWNSLKSTKTKIIRGEAVSIIQHPMGRPKMIAIRENNVVDILERFIHYTTDTEPGSSGSLVANDQWEIVALHQSSIPERDENDNVLLKNGAIYQSRVDEPLIKWYANQGVLMEKILEDIYTRKMLNKQEEEIKNVLLSHFQSSNQRETYRLPGRKH